MISLTSAFLGYCALEVAYRWHRYRELASAEEGVELWVVDAPLWEFDEQRGFRYVPGTRTQFRHFDREHRLLRTSRVEINAQGRPSPVDEPARTPDEWRIAVLGNSFAAGLNQDDPWPHLLQERIAADEALLERVGRRRVSVVNLGLDGTGITQWRTIAEAELPLLDPDLVLVDFITDDVRRRFVWREMASLPELAEPRVLLISASLPVELSNPDCVFGRMVALPEDASTSPESLAHLVATMRGLQIRRLPWGRIYPEFLAHVFGDHLPLHPRLRPGARNPRFDDDREAVARSAEALAAIVGLHRDVLVLHHPSWQELLHGADSAIVDRMESVSGVPIVRMLNRLPLDSDAEQKRSWFLLPEDGHHSDAGNAVYAEAVHRLLREHARR